MVLEIGAGFIFGFGIAVLMLVPAKALGATACLGLGRCVRGKRKKAS